MSTDTTRAPGAQPADAPAIPFDPANPDHQRAWESVLNMGRYETERRAQEAESAEQPADWNAALARYRAAADACNKLDAEQGEAKDQEEQEARVARISNERWDALTDLLNFPAPDVRAIRDKLLAVRENDPSSAWDTLGDDIALIAKDAERLIGSDEPGKPEDWPANLAAFRKASGEYRHYLDHGDGSDEIGGPLFDRFALALDKVLLTPAPDFAALAQKLAIYNANEIDDGWNIAREMTDLLAQDAARLTWQAALVSFDQATAAMKTCQNDAEADAIVDAQVRTVVPLLLTPAPDAAALSRKLEIIRVETAWDMIAADEIMDSFAEDLRRLTAEDA